MQLGDALIKKADLTDHLGQIGFDQLGPLCRAGYLLLGPNNGEGAADSDRRHEKDQGNTAGAGFRAKFHALVG